MAVTRIKDSDIQDNPFSIAGFITYVAVLKWHFTTTSFLSKKLMELLLLRRQMQPSYTESEWHGVLHA